MKAINFLKVISLYFLCHTFSDLFCGEANAQGLENIRVEKYYISDKKDSIGSRGNLPSGSVTYRIYVDMLPGYRFQSAFGTDGHELHFETSTKFFNHEEYGSYQPNSMTKSSLTHNTVMLDSWLSVGAACSGYLGVLKSVDNGIGTVINSDHLLQNDDTLAGIPLTQQDGMVLGTVKSIILAGLDAYLPVFDDGTANGKLFSVNDGFWAASGGVSGPDSRNQVLIAQITTNGIFSFMLNINLLTPEGKIEEYVAKDPSGGEIQRSFLSQTFNPNNLKPVIRITAPVSGTGFITGDTIRVEATASDSDGYIQKVSLYMNGRLEGTDSIAPYQFKLTGETGIARLVAFAFDNMGAYSSDTVSLIVKENSAPEVQITEPGNGGAFLKGTVISFKVHAADPDGSISSVEFFANEIPIGVAVNRPYMVSWAANSPGIYKIRARATDNRGITSVEDTIIISIEDPAFLPYKIGDLRGSCYEDYEISMPLIVMDTVHNCKGYNIVIQYNPHKVRPTGKIDLKDQILAKDYVNCNYNAGYSDSTVKISMTLKEGIPPTENFNGKGELFCLEFVKTSDFGSKDTAIFNVLDLSELHTTGDLKKLAGKGSYISYTDSIFRGHLRFWADNSPLTYSKEDTFLYRATRIVGIDSVGNAQEFSPVVSDLHGDFTYNIKENTTILIDRDVPDSEDVSEVINGRDAALTARVIAEDPSFTPTVFQIIAMDVNLDGFITAGDISQMSQRTVKIIDEYKQVNNYSDQGISNGEKSKDWLFIPNDLLFNYKNFRKSNLYPKDDFQGYSRWRVPEVPEIMVLPVDDNNGCPFIHEETYKAVLLGDTDGNYKNIASHGAMKSTAVNKPDTVYVDFSRKSSSNGVFKIPVSIKASGTVNSLDIIMRFNSDRLWFDELINQTKYITPLAYYNKSDRTLRITSYSLEPYESGKVLLLLCITDNGKAAEENSLFSVRALINGENAIVKNIDSEYQNVEEEKKDRITIKYAPNPAHGVLNVTISANSKIQLLDIKGIPVTDLIYAQAGQEQQIDLTGLSYGVYLLKVNSNSGVVIGKVIIDH